MHLDVEDLTQSQSRMSPGAAEKAPAQRAGEEASIFQGIEAQVAHEIAGNAEQDHGTDLALTSGPTRVGTAHGAPSQTGTPLVITGHSPGSSTVLPAHKVAQLDPDQIADALRDAMKRVGKQVVGREELLEQTILALLTREHQLIYSRAGVAKSMYAAAVFGQFREAHTFTMQLTKGTPEEGLVGGVDIDQFKKGNIIHNTDGSIVEAKLAFLDEVFDANDVTLRSLLGILNERQFRKGKQHVEAEMHTAIATSNYVRSTDVTEAVIDRFAFRAILRPEQDQYDMLLVDEAYEEHVGKVALPPEHKRIPIEQIEFLADVVEGRIPEHRISAPAHVLFMKNYLVDEYTRIVNAERAKKGEKEVYISPRTRAKTRDVLNASALLDHRDVVDQDDLAKLRHMLTVIGDTTQEKAFNQALQKTITDISKKDRTQVDMLMEANELVDAIMKRVEEGVSIKPSLWDRIKIFFHLTTLSELTFSRIEKTVGAINIDNPAVDELRQGLLKRLERDKRTIDERRKNNA